MAEGEPRTRPEPPPAPRDEALESDGEQSCEGLSARHQSVASWLARLTTTARSFSRRDPADDALHRLLDQLLQELTSLIQPEGELVVRVHPFELRFEGQVVYLNRDREKSIAFRLHRDGVRQLRFTAGLDWSELTRLIEILSVRFAGIEQHEEDTLTLLWKARISHLEVVALPGAVSDPDASTAAPRSAVLTASIELPRPELPPPKGPSWAALSEERLCELRAEVDPDALPASCISLVERLRHMLSDPRQRTRFAEVAHLFTEVRDYLLTDQGLRALKDLVSLLSEMATEDAPPWDEARPAALRDLLEGCGDRRAVDRLLRSIPSEERQLNPQLLDVLNRSCPDPVAAVIDALGEDRGPGARSVARQIIECFGKERWSLIQQKFRDSTGQQASDLLRVMARIGGEDATSFVARQAAHSDPAVQDEALWHLEHMPFSGTVGRALMEALRVTDSARRFRVLDIIAGTGDRRFLDHLTAYVDERANSMSTDEAARIGRILGAAGGEASIPRWQAWLKPAGGPRKGFEGPLARQVTAALALAHIPGERAAEALGAAFDFADDVSQAWILGALGYRQRQPGGKR